MLAMLKYDCNSVNIHNRCEGFEGGLKRLSRCCSGTLPDNVRVAGIWRNASIGCVCIRLLMEAVLHRGDLSWLRVMPLLTGAASAHLVPAKWRERRAISVTVSACPRTARLLRCQKPWMRGVTHLSLPRALRRCLRDHTSSAQLYTTQLPKSRSSLLRCQHPMPHLTCFACLQLILTCLWDLQPIMTCLRANVAPCTSHTPHTPLSSPLPDGTQGLGDSFWASDKSLSPGRSSRLAQQQA